MSEKYFEQLSQAYLAHFCRRLADLIIEQGSETLKDMGLKTPTTAVSSLLYLADNNEVSVADLAEALGVSHQMATQRVQGLEKLGLVSRIPSANDKRAKQVVLTQLAETEIKQLIPLTKNYTKIFAELEAEIGCNLSQAIRKTELALISKSLKSRLNNTES